MQVNQAIPAEADVYLALKYRIVVDKAGRRLCLNHNGDPHCEDGPAIVWANGTKEWYQNGLHHREDGPAVEFPSGMHKWCLNGIIFSQQRYYKRLAELGIANDH